MKKFFLVIFSLLLFSVEANILKAGICEDYIPSGFFGSWGVISKLNSSNNPSLFNMESRDIWTLSGYNNILILENLESGAKSSIEIKDKTQKDVLKFVRTKTVKENDLKIIYREIVNFKLSNNRFSGTDIFSVQKYDKNNTLIENNKASYNVEGTKISGNTPLD